MSGSTSAGPRRASYPKTFTPRRSACVLKSSATSCAAVVPSWTTYTLLLMSVPAAKSAATRPWTSSRPQTRLTLDRFRSVSSVPVPAGETIASAASL